MSKSNSKARSQAAVAARQDERARRERAITDRVARLARLGVTVVTPAERLREAACHAHAHTRREARRARALREA